jgi:2-polyprenyl-3-methyl-5-hydroxy-6-metoxy-1,4-benzoquinol methylase
MSEEATVWHEVECGAYAEDLSLWEELAAERGSPVLELGCGTGRVARHLARRGFSVHALDADPSLLQALEDRAARERLGVVARCLDVRELADQAAGVYPLVLAPMQLIQLVGGVEGRAATLGGVAHILQPGGLAAFAIVEGTDGIVGAADPGVVPDVRERDGWLHSSLPVGVAARDGHLEVRRLRQVVSPAGELTDAEHVERLAVLDAPTLERDGRAAGLEPAGRRALGSTDLHVGSTVVLLRRPA